MIKIRALITVIYELYNKIINDNSDSLFQLERSSNIISGAVYFEKMHVTIRLKNANKIIKEVDVDYE